MGNINVLIKTIIDNSDDPQILILNCPALKRELCRLRHDYVDDDDNDDTDDDDNYDDDHNGLTNTEARVV